MGAAGDDDNCDYEHTNCKIETLFYLPSTWANSVGRDRVYPFGVRLWQWKPANNTIWDFTRLIHIILL